MTKHHLLAAAAVLAVLSLDAAGAATITEFDPPGTMNIVPANPLDDKGYVVCNYLDDEDGTFKGFVRKPAGHARTLFLNGTDTVVQAAGGNGLVAGDVGLESRGFLIDVRHKSGPTIFEVRAGHTGTHPLAVNAHGAVAGIFYQSGDQATHGFIRQPDGTIETFDGPKAALTFAGTWVQAINKKGEVAGWTTDEGSTDHLFYRLASGRIVGFKLPNQSKFNAREQRAYAINAKGTVAGYFTDRDEAVHGFLRDRHGNATLVDVDVADAGATHVFGLNDKGVATGEYIDGTGAHHGFVRAAGGAIATFDAPDAGVTAGRGTTPLNVNNDGTIAGYYLSSDGRKHMFLRRP